VAACAAVFRAALVLGCDCWRRWQEMRIDSEALAQHHCTTRHDLREWDREGPLPDFLVQAAVQGALHLPGPERGKGEQAYASDSRRGMLAKVVADANLVAGPVLRCARPGCSGEIRPNDRCDGCGEPARVREISWWLWRQGERQSACC